MPNEKFLSQIRAFRPRILKICEQTSFGQTLNKIKTSRNLDFVFCQKANVGQMLAVLIGRLLGKKYLWVQGFANPPSPNFLTRLLLSQADHILVKSYYQAKKLQFLGIDKSKITISRG